MPGAYFPDRVRSLAATATGEEVEIRRILFDAVRGLCADLGVREGDIVRCRADTSSHLLLDTPRGKTVTLERDWARFIQVSGRPSTSGSEGVSGTKELVQGVG